MTSGEINAGGSISSDNLSRKQTDKNSSITNYSQQVKSRWRDFLFAVRFFSKEYLHGFLGTLSKNDYSYQYKKCIAAYIDKVKSNPGDNIKPNETDYPNIKKPTNEITKRKVDEGIKCAYKYFVFDNKREIKNETFNHTIEYFKNDKFVSDERVLTRILIENLLIYYTEKSDEIEKIKKMVELKDKIFSGQEEFNQLPQEENELIKKFNGSTKQIIDNWIIDNYVGKVEVMGRNLQDLESLSSIYNNLVNYYVSLKNVNEKESDKKTLTFLYSNLIKIENDKSVFYKHDSQKNNNIEFIQKEKICLDNVMQLNEKLINLSKYYGEEKGTKENMCNLENDNNNAIEINGIEERLKYLTEMLSGGCEK